MENKIISKKICFLTSGLLLLILLTASLIVLLIPSNQVYAATNDALIVEDMSDDCAITKKYTNIQGFLNSKKSRSRSMSEGSQVDLLLDTLNINKDDLDCINESALLSARSITVSDTLMITDEDGNLSTLATEYKTEKDFPDIPGDNGKAGYMAGRIVVIQSPEYDKYNNQNKFLAYGFECSFSMRWLKDPLYTMKDYFTFCADNGAYTEDDVECTLTADVRSESPSIGIERYTYSTKATVAYKSSGWPVCYFNLYNDVYTANSSIDYSNYRISARARIFSQNNFLIRMCYAHKQLVGGDLKPTISISSSGPSISFSGTSHREYQSPNFNVGFDMP